MQPAEVYRLARAAGLDDEAAVIATAIAWAESDLDADAIGDEALEDEKWGPSCGLWQIRSLRAQLGTGLERDRNRLLDPEFNARSMSTISGGANWTPWTMFRNGRYRAYLDDVVDAIEGGRPPMKFVSRAGWAARSASTSTNITPVGVAVHWEGPHMGTPDHGSCAGVVRGIQAYHMDTNSWADIAYSAIVCPHGYVFEGRGPGHRTAANGTNDGNQRFYAVCFMGGEGDVFTDEAKNGINDAIDWLGGGEVTGHRDHTSTACPGEEIYAWVRAGHPRSDSARPSQEDQMFSPSPTYTVHIVASHSGLLLTSSGEHHGAGVIQRPADGSLNQRWKVHDLGGGQVVLVNRAGGLALDRPDYVTEAGTLLQVARNEGNDAQRWVLDQLKPFLARLWAPGTNRCLDVRMRSTEPGAGLQLWYGLADGEDPRHQQFVFAPTV